MGNPPNIKLLTGILFFFGVKLLIGQELNLDHTENFGDIHISQFNMDNYRTFSIPSNTGDNLNMRLLGRWANGRCKGVAAVGNIAYFGNGAYLEIVDFSDPNSPFEICKVLVPSPIEEVFISSNYAYIANGEDGIWK